VSGSVVFIQTALRHAERETLEEVRLVDGGMTQDYHFGSDKGEELLLMENETLRSLGLPPGGVMENLTVEGVAIMGLPAGTRLTLGEAEVEITKECLPCAVMDRIRPGLREELAGRRGMHARVLREGLVRTGDGVTVVKAGT
jgi:MOSC domain-containing protein YiiM